ncbi:hypothetical protein H6F54_24825 [Coleofasciculus sp. FACHB-501]|nr:hypothetical protein [Coleofasciculus sp. FACHB-501]
MKSILAQKNLPNSTYIGENNPSGDLMRSLRWKHRSFQSTPPKCDRSQLKRLS